MFCRRRGGVRAAVLRAWGRPGPGLPGFGAPAGRVAFARMFRNPRRTRAGVSRPGGPTISGTEAGQSTASGQPNSPFSSAKIADPNIDTTNSLSIQLTGGGGTLSDGAGFDGLTTSAPGVYILSGTAAAITSELEALVFTPNTFSATTTFTLTDTVSLGTSKSNANTTVTVTKGEPVVVSVSKFLADQSTLDQIPGGFDILDGAAHITTNLDQLNDSHIDAIVISNNGNVGASVQQLTTDATAIGKLQNANLSPARLAIHDTAADVQAGLSTLVQDTGEIGSITASDGPIVVSAATFLADRSTLDKIVGGFDVSDTEATLAIDLNQLDDPNISTITISDNVQMTAFVAQLTTDATAIGKLKNANASPVLLAIYDTAGAVQTGLSTLVARYGRDRLDHHHHAQLPDRRFGGHIRGRSVDARQNRGRVRRHGYGGQSGGGPLDPQRQFRCGRHHGRHRRRDAERRRQRECAELLGIGLGDEPDRQRAPRLRRRLQSGRGFDAQHIERRYAFADGNSKPERDDERGRDAGAGRRERDDRQRRDNFGLQLVDLRRRHGRDARREPRATRGRSAKARATRSSCREAISC